MVPPKSPGGTKDLKTTTIVMSKHTLAPQNTNVSTFIDFTNFNLKNSCMFLKVLTNLQEVVDFTNKILFIVLNITFEL